jgi:hypothetical protein
MLPIPALIRLFGPGVLKKMMDYVFKENNLDQQMASIRARLDNLEKPTKESK